MMGSLLAAAKACAPDDSVYGGGEVVTGCLPNTGADHLLSLVLLGVALILIGIAARLLRHEDEAEERALEAARRGHVL